MSDTPAPTPSTPKPPHILFLFSDTGGGHRSAAEAIIEALHLEYGQRLTTEMVDIFKEYAPKPLNNMPIWYPTMVKIPQLWGLGYQISNGRRRSRLLSASTWLYVRRAIRRLIEDHPSNVIVSVHPLVNTPMLNTLKGHTHVPFITVVTDLATTHAFWYDRRTDLCIVPTEEAARRAQLGKVAPEKIKVIGLPVADRFCQPPGDRGDLRRQLGWPTDRPMVVLIGGGDGMGPIGQTAQAIADARLPVGLAVVAGRNEKLKHRLEATQWPMPTFIYGFVRNMPDFMNAADILVTKAGPGTICEALNAGLPMILYSRLPGQEDGNVTFVVNEGAGVWAPKPEQIIKTLRTWVEQPAERQKAVAACRAAARPQAARQIAHILAAQAGLGK